MIALYAASRHEVLCSRHPCAATMKFRLVAFRATVKGGHGAMSGTYATSNDSTHIAASTYRHTDYQVTCQAYPEPGAVLFSYLALALALAYLAARVLLSDVCRVIHPDALKVWKLNNRVQLFATAWNNRIYVSGCLPGIEPGSRYQSRQSPPCAQCAAEGYPLACSAQADQQ